MPAESSLETPRDEADHDHDLDRAVGAIHPHPLANELTDDASVVELPGADPRTDHEAAAVGANRGGKRAMRWGAVIGGVVLLVALIVCALLFRNQRELIVVGAFALTAYGLLLAAPMLLALGTKVVQDESTRETAGTARGRGAAHVGRESHRQS